MKKLISKGLLAVILTVGLVGCDYVPRKIFKIETVDGTIITLACPEVDRNRSTFTYLRDGDCIIVTDN